MRRTLTSLLLLLPLTVAAADTATIVKCSMTPDGIVSLFMSGYSFHYSIPRVIVFDADGNEVTAFQGYGPKTESQIQDAVRQHGRAGAYQLTTLARLLRSEDGKPLDVSQLKGTPVVAELGADWCVPCKKLREDVHRIAGATVLEIDADMQKHPNEVQAAIQRRLRH